MNNSLFNKQPPPYFYRLMDANLNRLGEGLRALEDVARLALNDPAITIQLKTMRHHLEKVNPKLKTQLFSARDAAGDVGIDPLTNEKLQTTDIASFVISNARRAQQAARVLEEMAKLVGPDIESDKYKKARFQLYSLETELVSRLSRMDKRRKVKGVYVILDSSWLDMSEIPNVAEKVIASGVGIIQLRAKNQPSARVYSVGCRLREICGAHDVLLIVNDSLEIALACSADGLHLGQGDLPIGVARRLMPPEVIIGVSVSSPAQARQAEEAGADYIACQSVFKTYSKPDIQTIGKRTLSRIRASTVLPLVAIGGINHDNIHQVISAGADCVAVISAVCGSSDPAKAAGELVDIFNSI